MGQSEKSLYNVKKIGLKYVTVLPNVKLSYSNVAIVLATFSPLQPATKNRNGKLAQNYIENDVAEYMKSLEIKINVQIGNGSKDFEVYTMDLTKKYIEINADYRT